MQYISYISDCLEPFLKNLDPSLFQNIILGILAIFIPFAIVFLTDLLRPEQKRSELEKMVLTEEVLGTKRLFWLSVIGIFVLAFFTGKDISILEKLFTIIFSAVLVFLFWKPFRRILRFSEGYKPEFEISFLKGLSLSKIFSFGNKTKLERMTRAWNSFWSEKSEYNESEFTKVFITHIDNLLDARKFDYAIQLSQSYVKNLEKRNRFSVGYEILPKIFEWNEKLRNEQELERKNEFYYEKKIEQVFPVKYLPTFRKRALNILKKIHTEDNSFWNWHYVQQEFFPAVAKNLLYDTHGSFQLFSRLKKHIEDKESKQENPEEDQKHWNDILGIFAVFCPMFFENINSVQGKYDIWEHHFPEDWKISVNNSKKRIPRVILHEFHQWARERAFKENRKDYDDKLDEVVNGIFPNVHHDLFPAFLALFFYHDIKDAIQKEPNFHIANMSVSWSGEKPTNEEIGDAFLKKEVAQKNETAEIIFAFFGFWSKLQLFKDDLSEEENTNWKELLEEKRKQILGRVRQTKLQKMLDELNGPELEKMCKDSEILERRRKEFVELIQLLIQYVEKQ